MTTLTITIHAGASKALTLAAERAGVSVDEYTKRSLLQATSRDLYGPDEKIEPEIAEMFLRCNPEPFNP